MLGLGVEGALGLGVGALGRGATGLLGLGVVGLELGFETDGTDGLGLIDCAGFGEAGSRGSVGFEMELSLS